jgi:hypothetical protein
VAYMCSPWLRAYVGRFAVSVEIRNCRTTTHSSSDKSKFPTLCRADKVRSHQ